MVVRIQWTAWNNLYMYGNSSCTIRIPRVYILYRIYLIIKYNDQDTSKYFMIAKTLLCNIKFIILTFWVAYGSSIMLHR